VGFIRKLPHRLVDAFKATLEEVVQADLLLHVVDVSHPQAEAQMLAATAVLEEIGASGKPTLFVLNKIDRFENGEGLNKYRERFPNAVGVSAKTGAGFTALLAALSSVLRPIRRYVELVIPPAASAIIARLHAMAQVVELDYDGPLTRLKARMPPHLLHELERFIVREL
jgi:GTP-binding protein HflX